MSLCYIHSEGLLFYSSLEQERERKEAGEEKTQCLENWDYFRALAMPKIPLSSQ